MVGLDLATHNVDQMRRAGLRAVAGSLFDLPVRPGHFEAIWTMSTLVHVPDEHFDQAMESITSVAIAGAPIGIGTWGGFDWQGVSDRDEIEPRRFFALRGHDRFEASLGCHGAVEAFSTYHPNPESRWEYQFAVLRV